MPLLVQLSANVPGKVTEDIAGVLIHVRDPEVAPDSEILTGPTPVVVTMWEANK